MNIKHLCVLLILSFSMGAACEKKKKDEKKVEDVFKESDFFEKPASNLLLKN